MSWNHARSSGFGEGAATLGKYVLLEFYLDPVPSPRLPEVVMEGDKRRDTAHSFRLEFCLNYGPINTFFGAPLAPRTGAAFDAEHTHVSPMSH